MFYTDELSTTRKGSLGIIWLMATLGPRSKKVTRKQLSSVEITTTCDLIANPPEPMALRLRSQLLVGVARVFYQNFEAFYSDVRTFDTTLRRSIVATFGNGVTLNSTIADGGLDLQDGGKASAHQITLGNLLDYAGDDPLSALDFGFSLDNLNIPLGVSTQLSSVPPEEPSEEQNDVENSREKSNSLPPSSQASSTGSRNRIGRNSDPYDEVTTFEPIDLGIINDFDLGAQYSSDGPPPLPSDNADIQAVDSSLEVNINPDEMMELDAPPQDRDQDPTAEMQEPSKSPHAKRKSSSPSNESEEEQPAVPKKKRKAKKIVIDKHLENADDPNADSNTYALEMAPQKEEQQAKHTEQANIDFALRIFDAGGMWVEFLDDGMSAFYQATCKPGQFQWEKDVEHHRLKEKGAIPAHIQELPNPESDPIEQPWSSNEPGDIQHNTVDDGFNFQDLPPSSPPNARNSAPGGHSNSPEHGRRQTNADTAAFPWEFDESLELPVHAGDMTPASHRRFSIMTPEEKRLRGRQTSSPMIPRIRSRSGSLASAIPADELMDIDHDALPANDGDNEEQAPYSPGMMAMIEAQCRQFFQYVEDKMNNAGADEVQLEDILPRPATKKTAAQAFYNCLTLATKHLLALSQEESFGPVTIRIVAPKPITTE